MQDIRETCETFEIQGTGEVSGTQDPCVAWLKNCRLCPRDCGVDRLAGQTGYCGSGAAARVAHTQLHMWEEPCISGREGSGTVFFSGCSLGCVYCQNRAINDGTVGRDTTDRELADIFLSLQAQGANNINLVTAAHFVPQTVRALRLVKGNALKIPVVYNSSGYEKTSALRLLEGSVDVYLPDLKFVNPDTALRYAGAPDYPETARSAIAEMVRQAGKPVFDSRGMIRKGVIVRILLLPGHVREAKEAVSYLLDTYGDDVYISLMNQYTPMPGMEGDPLLSRKVTRREYERLVGFALSYGLVNGYIQEGETAKESFIPMFGKGL